MPQGNLPAEAKKIFNAAEASAKKSTCKNAGDRQAECAARVAWAAVKQKYKKVGDKWVRKANLAEFSLYIHKAVLDKPTGQYKVSCVASDTDEDARGDNMTRELFNDFVYRIEKNEPAPEIFRSEYWTGGMPYLSIAHYSDQNGEGVPGEIEKVYVDGNRLKSTHMLHDNSLGRACFKSICNDLYGEEKLFPDNPVRISIGFIDWKHQHKNGGFIFERKSLTDICPECKNGNTGKRYLRGQLVHQAYTRVPVNPRTPIELEELSMIETRKEDAESIIGEAADELDERELIGKSETAFVVKSDDDTTTVANSDDVTEEPLNLEGEHLSEEDREKKRKKKVMKGEDEEEDDELKQTQSMAVSGPTTIKDMIEAQKAAEEMNRVTDLWYMFSDVVYNIFRSEEIEDKKQAIDNATQEFKNMLVAKALTAEEKNDPLNKAWSDFSKAFSELPEEATPQDKLKAIQPHFNELGQRLGEIVEQSQTEPTTTPAPSSDGVMEKLSDVLDAMNKRLALLETAITSNGNQVQVPVRRSVAPSLVQQTTPVNQPKKKLSSLSAAINKSVGLPEDHARQGATYQE